MGRERWFATLGGGALFDQLQECALGKRPPPAAVAAGLQSLWRDAEQTLAFVQASRLLFKAQKNPHRHATAPGRRLPR